MKKTYIDSNNERFALYADVDSVDGGWVLETNGGATCLNEMEDAESNELDQINAVISAPTTVWEPLTEDDKEYIFETLESWGI